MCTSSVYTPCRTERVGVVSPASQWLKWKPALAFASTSFARSPWFTSCMAMFSWVLPGGGTSLSKVPAPAGSAMYFTLTFAVLAAIITMLSSSTAYDAAQAYLQRNCTYPFPLSWSAGTLTFTLVGWGLDAKVYRSCHPSWSTCIWSLNSSGASVCEE